MRIGFVTQWFPPEPGTDVAARIANGLAARGHQVDVVTGFPNYPTGQLQAGYQLQPYAVEQRDQVTVHRCLLFPSHNRSPVGRAVNYLSFAAGATWGVRHFPRPDVWLVYSSPATTAIPALLAGSRHRAPICLIIQDLWPESVVDSAFLGPRSVQVARRVLDRFCDWTYRRAAAIGVISPTMATVLRERGVPASKIFSTPNPAPDAGTGRPGTERRRDRLGLPPGPLFMYAGNLGELQGLGPVLDAFQQVPEATLVLVGDGVERERLEGSAWRASASNIRFLGPRPAVEIPDLVEASDVQVVSLKDTPLLRATMPSKVQFILSAGKPVLAHAAGDVAALVEQERCGWAALPGAVPRLVEHVRAACQLSSADLAQIGSRGRAYADRHFAPDVVAEGLEIMLTAAVRAASDSVSAAES